MPLLHRRLAPAEMYPAGEQGIRVYYLRLPSGLRLRVLECGPARGEPVLLIPGWAASVYLYRKNIHAVAATGHRVVALDLPGQGLSDKPEALDVYTTDGMVTHVRAAMDALDLERPVVVGTSMGGGIALEIGLRAPERVRALALINPVGLGTVRVLPVAHLRLPHAVVRVLPRRLLPHLVPRWLVALALRSIYGHVTRPSARDVDEYWAPSQFPGYVLAAYALLRAYSWRPLTDERLAGLRVPVLAVLGGADPLLNARVSEQRVRLMPGAVCAVIPRAGHAANEEAPEETNAALARFLDEVRGLAPVTA